MASESPFDRLGKLVLEQRDELRVPLYGGVHENAFTVAHRGNGEWRSWRDVCEVNGVEDPLAMREAVVTSSGDFVVEEGASLITKDTGIGLRVMQVSENLPTDLQIRVEDISETVHEVWIESAALGAGDRVSLTRAVFDTPGATTRLVLTLNTDLFMEIELSIDAWLILWLGRCFDLNMKLIVERAEVIVPPLLLGEGRGE